MQQKEALYSSLKRIFKRASETRLASSCSSKDVHGGVSGSQAAASDRMEASVSAGERAKIWQRENRQAGSEWLLRFLNDRLTDSPP